MGKLFFLAFLVVPFLELYLLLLIGRHLGLWPTVWLVLVTGLLGATLAKREGRRVLRDWRDSLARGQLPEEGLVGGALVLVGGVMLVAPGVLTDLTGLLLLLPPVRRWVAVRVRHRLERHIRVGTLHVNSPHPGPFAGPGGARPSSRQRPDVLDAEFTDSER